MWVSRVLPFFPYFSLLILPFCVFLRFTFFFFFFYLSFFFFFFFFFVLFLVYHSSLIIISRITFYPIDLDKSNVSPITTGHVNNYEKFCVLNMILYQQKKGVIHTKLLRRTIMQFIWDNMIESKHPNIWNYNVCIYFIVSWQFFDAF